MVHLPLEILGIIIEILISEPIDMGESYQEVLLPPWFLVPLLRVCRAWYPSVEQYLYRSISVGDKFPHRIAEVEDEPTADSSSAHIQESAAKDNKNNRSGRKIAEDLLATLEHNARLAGLVRELRLGIDSESWSETSNAELTRIGIRILQCCPNVEHVRIRDFHRSEGHAVFAALKEKSLVSFHSSHWVSCLDSSQIFNLMQNWTQLRHIEVTEQWSSPGFGRELVAFDIVVPALCPELHTLILSDRNVTDDAMLSALNKHLNAWSSTLVCLKLSIRKTHPVSQHLSKAFSSLKCIRHLQVYGMELDMVSLSDLPQLEILAFDGLDKQTNSLVECLEDLDKFTALSLVNVLHHPGVLERLLHVCSGRKIRCSGTSGYFPVLPAT